MTTNFVVYPLTYRRVANPEPGSEFPHGALVRRGPFILEVFAETHGTVMHNTACIAASLIAQRVIR